MKLRTYDNKTLADIFVTASQIEATITKLLSNKEKIKGVTDLPDSLVPTGTLYELVLCYNALYTILSAEHLKEDAQHNSNNTIH
jgi:hypothetical protein